MNHGKPIPESRPSRRTFNTPNAAGVSRDTDAGPDSDQRPTGQPASSTSQRRDANGTTDCTTNADYRQAASKELAAKTKAVAAGRRNPVKFAGHRSWFSTILVTGRGPLTVDEKRNHHGSRRPRTNGFT